MQLLTAAAAAAERRLFPHSAGDGEIWGWRRREVGLRRFVVVAAEFELVDTVALPVSRL